MSQRIDRVHNGIVQAENIDPPLGDPAPGLCQRHRCHIGRWHKRLIGRLAGTGLRHYLLLMTSNPDMMTLPEEMRLFLQAIRRHQVRDVPPRWAEDEFRRHEAITEDLHNWKIGLVDRIEAELAE